MLNCKKTIRAARCHTDCCLGWELLDGEPDGFVAGFGLDDLLFELVEPLAAFEDLAYELVAAYEDAAGGVLGGVAGVDADALELAVEVGAAEQ